MPMVTLPVTWLVSALVPSSAVGQMANWLSPLTALRLCLPLSALRLVLLVRDSVPLPSLTAGSTAASAPVLPLAAAALRLALPSVRLQAVSLLRMPSVPALNFLCLRPVTPRSALILAWTLPLTATHVSPRPLLPMLLATGAATPLLALA